MPVSAARSMASVVDGTLVQPRFRTLLSSTFALLALLLSAIGVYGLMANRVAARTHEMGIRLALGASKRRLMVMVVRQGMMVVLGGTLVGLAGAVVAARLLGALLFGVTPTDPLTFVLVPMLLVSIAAIAAWVPARRAARIPLTRVMREN